MRRSFRIALAATLLLVATVYTVALPWWLAWEYRLDAVADPFYVAVLAPSVLLVWSYLRTLRGAGRRTQLVGRAALTSTAYVVLLAGTPVILDVVFLWLLVALALLALADRLTPALLVGLGTGALALLTLWTALAPPTPVS